MTLRFVAIDFETANRNHASACSIGLVRVRDGQIAERHYSLIKPPQGLDEFSHFNTGIHGIDAAMVHEAPTFDGAWPTIREFIGDDVLVAHNATFDMDVLRECLKIYGLPPVKIPFTCTYRISQQLLDLLNYKLPTVYEELIDGEFAHHDALADALASAEILSALASRLNLGTLDELMEQANLNFGNLDTSEGGGFNVMRRGRAVSYKRADINRMQSEVDLSQVDPENPCFGLEFVFTGTLDSMDRKTAQEKVMAKGGRTGSSVTKTTNILVEGHQDLRQLVPGASHSRAYEKAMNQKSLRSDIEVIDETTFLGMLSD